MYQHVKVADFGLVKDLEGMQASVTGGVTPVYAAPETFDGWVSRFCDQYSLAIVYQELLTGQRPFAGNNVRQLILQHLQAAPNLSSLPAEDQPVIGRGAGEGSGPALSDVPRHGAACCGRTPVARRPRRRAAHRPRRPYPANYRRRATATKPKPADNTSPPTANMRSRPQFRPDSS